MPNSKKQRKTASGCGSIRQKTVLRDGKEYTYWEARYTAGRDPGSGKQIQRSITGKTQREVAQKLKAITVSLDEGTYVEPTKMTVAQWLDIWQEDYLISAKPSTVSSYRAAIRNHLKPGLGATRLDALTTQIIS